MSKSTDGRNDAVSTDAQPTHAEIMAARRGEAEVARALEIACDAGRISREAYAKALVELSFTKFPVGWTLGPCPSWCVTDHEKNDWCERGEGLRGHSSEPVRIATSSTDKEAWVEVCVMDNLEDEVRYPASVVVSCTDDLDPVNARLLAEAIVIAAHTAEAWNTAPSGAASPDKS